MSLNLVFTGSLFDAQHQRDSVENKPTNLLVLPLGKALNRIFHSLSGRKMADNS